MNRVVCTALLLCASFGFARVPVEVKPITFEKVLAIQDRVSQVGVYLKATYAPYGIGVNAYMRPLRHVTLTELTTALVLTPEQVQEILAWEPRFVVYRLVDEHGNVGGVEYVGIRWRVREAS